MIKDVKLSASRVKKLQACSWQYYASYVLKLPDKTNEGALSGTCCHTIFECLLKSRHRKHFDRIIQENDVAASLPISRYVKNYVLKHNLSDGREQLICDMILVGLKEDFFRQGCSELSPELKFDISSSHPKYRITGFIDQFAKYEGRFSRIVDFKSSKQRFEGEELTVNIQGMMYSLASKKLWPALTPVVDFVFLQFPDAPIQRLRFSNEQLRGFEHMLAETQSKMENFDYKAAVSNLASKQKLPAKGEGFKGPLLCGWAGKGYVQSPDQKKKNGDPAFFCPYKFAFDYWALCNENGDVVKTSKEPLELEADAVKGEFVVKKRYDGCPGHKKMGA